MSNILADFNIYICWNLPRRYIYTYIHIHIHIHTHTHIYIYIYIYIYICVCVCVCVCTVKFVMDGRDVSDIWTRKSNIQGVGRADEWTSHIFLEHVDVAKHICYMRYVRWHLWVTRDSNILYIYTYIYIHLHIHIWYLGKKITALYGIAIETTQHGMWTSGIGSEWKHRHWFSCLVERLWHHPNHTIRYLVIINKPSHEPTTGIILCMRPANERRR